mmetsp:Transcript_36171/g.85762  ORF Transcript_36171/g.85762 Transcript_36171/m.85762 type:complete len:231 (-) Transcript_36171:48-740(-)
MLREQHAHLGAGSWARVLQQHGRAAQLLRRLRGHLHPQPASRPRLDQDGHGRLVAIHADRRPALDGSRCAGGCSNACSLLPHLLLGAEASARLPSAPPPPCACFPPRGHPGSGQGRPVRAEQGCRGEHQGCYAGWRTLPQPADERVSRTPSAREEMKSCRLEGLDSTRNQCQRNQVSGTIRAGILGFCLSYCGVGRLGMLSGDKAAEMQPCLCMCLCLCTQQAEMDCAVF